jgi:transposase InsO family protein
MARENPTWGQERIANELLLKLGLHVSPRTVRKYMPKRVDHGRGPCMASQRWRTFVRNHAQAIVACDFCVVVTATFRLLYVFVVMEHATRRILHTNVTAHPTASWTLQQLREAIPADHGYRFLIHDRDSIFSQQLDQGIRHLGLKVLKTPPQSPQANALCERLLGTLRQECMDFVIPLTENHLRRLLSAWCSIITTAVRTWPWGRVFPSRSCRCRLPCRSSDIDGRHMAVLWRVRFLVGCTMNIGWKSRLRDSDASFLWSRRSGNGSSKTVHNASRLSN